MPSAHAAEHVAGGAGFGPVHGVEAVLGGGGIYREAEVAGGEAAAGAFGCREAQLGARRGGRNQGQVAAGVAHPLAQGGVFIEADDQGRAGAQAGPGQGRGVQIERHFAAIEVGRRLLKLVGGVAHRVAQGLALRIVLPGLVNEVIDVVVENLRAALKVRAIS